MAGYKELFSLNGRVALITGGAGILGQKFSRCFAEFGAKVAVVDIDGQAAKTLAKLIEHSYGVSALGITCDVTNPTEVAKTVSHVTDVLGPIDILHNNAATKGKSVDAFFSRYEEYSLDTWREIMAVNIDGMFVVSQAVGRQMIARNRSGSIIQTSSIYGIVAPDQRIYDGSRYQGRAINTPAVYATSKAAVIGLTKYLAAYWAGEGIRVNAITPGGIESGQNATFQKLYGDRVPLGRMAHADELAAAALFLASDASSYVTGQNLIVDGGLTAW